MRLAFERQHHTQGMWQATAPIQQQGSGQRSGDVSREDVSGESGLTTSAQGISELRVARMSRAKVARPPGRASPRSELRGCLRRKWPDYLGISAARVARTSQARVPRPPRGRAPGRSELRGGLRRKWPEHLSSGHLGSQSYEDIAGESGRTTRKQGIFRSELRECLSRQWP